LFEVDSKVAVERSAGSTTALSENVSHGTREVFIIMAVMVDIETGQPRYNLLSSPKRRIQDQNVEIEINDAMEILGV